MSMYPKKSHFPAFTRLTISIVGLCGFLFTSGVSAFIGQDIDLNLYKQIAKGQASFYQKTVTRSLIGSAKQLNLTTGCQTIFRIDINEDCFSPGFDFTIEDLETIQAGGIAPIIRHLVPSLQEKLTTENINSLEDDMVWFYEQLKAANTEKLEKIGKIGYTGLFSDGSLDNSSYDIAYDLEQINRVIFTEEIPYEGDENGVSGGMVGLLSGLYDNPQNDSPFGPSPYNPAGGTGNPTNPTNTGTLTPGSLTGSTTPTTSSGVLAANACNPSDLSNLDSGLFTDINNQVTTGGNGATSSTGLGQNNPIINGGGNAFSGSGNPSNNPPNGGGKQKNNKLADSFPCNTFFCIRVNFLIYQQKVFGSTKTYTIESVLDKNLKIADKFAGNSGTQSKMTRNFGQLDLRNLNLPSQVHIGVIVTKLPIPLLNVPRGSKSGGSDAINMKKEFEDEAILKKAFEMNGLNYKRQNDLVTLRTALAREIISSAELDSQAANNKQNTTADEIKKDGAELAAFSALMSQNLQTDYYDSFNNDLLALNSFTQGLNERIGNIISVIGRMYAIPQGSK